MSDIENNYRKSILNSLKDLADKIEKNEPFPEGNVQDVNFLSEISDRINECLNCWYY